MSHIFEEYAKHCGVRVGKPVLAKHFYPVPFKKYITIFTDGENPSLDYRYWDSVVALLRKALDPLKIGVVQLGGGKSRKIENCVQISAPNYKNYCHILQNSLAHVGILSYASYAASALGVNNVFVCSHVLPETFKPYWSNETQLKIVSPDFTTKKPSFAMNDGVAINTIAPEDIANPVLEFLGLEKLNIKTLHMGSRYPLHCVDVIPSELTSVKSDFINIRLDKHHNEGVANDILNNNMSCEVTTKLALDPTSFHANFKKIKAINYISADFDKNFVLFCKKHAIPLNLLCCDKNTLATQRAKLFDYHISEYYADEIAKANFTEKLKNITQFSISGNKAVVVGDRFFSSYSALNNNELCDDFLVDLDWYWLYHTAS